MTRNKRKCNSAKFFVSVTSNYNYLVYVKILAELCSNPFGLSNMSLAKKVKTTSKLTSELIGFDYNVTIAKIWSSLLSC